MAQQFKQRFGQISGRMNRIGNQIKALGIAGPPVHQDLVVPKTGGGFETVSIDSGTLASVSGNTLTIDESYSGQSYKTVTLTIPSGATIDRNFSSATLSDLKNGDHVSVATSSSGTHVTAWDPQHAPTPPAGHGNGMPGPPAGFMFRAP
jgi:hypothetical protein